jgi:hypothetical protein
VLLLLPLSQCPRPTPSSWYCSTIFTSFTIIAIISAVSPLYHSFSTAELL